MKLDPLKLSVKEWAALDGITATKAKSLVAAIRSNPPRNQKQLVKVLNTAKIRPQYYEAIGCLMDLPEAPQPSTATGPTLKDYDMGLSNLRELIGSDVNDFANNIVKDLKPSKPFKIKIPSDEALLEASGLSKKKLKKFLQSLSGEAIDDEQIDLVVRQGVANALTQFQLSLRPSITSDKLMEYNLVADGSFNYAQGTLLWQSPGGNNVVYNISDNESKETAKIILGVSLAVELVGVIAAIAGISLPKIPLAKVAKKLKAKFRSRSVRRAFKRFLSVLNNTRSTLKEKFDAILKILQVLGNIGLIGDLIAEIFADLSILRIGLIIVQVLAQIGLILLPGAQLTLLTQRAIAIATIVVALTEKARSLIDLNTA